MPSDQLKLVTLAICATPVCDATKCDWSGWIEFTEPTTGRVQGGSSFCKTCGAMAMSNSLRYGE